jgi:hypothetical protein
MPAVAVQVGWFHQRNSCPTPGTRGSVLPYSRQACSGSTTLDCLNFEHCNIMQALGQRCCPASRAKLRQVCSSWHHALASQFADIHIGPGSLWPDSSSAMEEEEEDADSAAAAATEQRVAAVRRAFPSVSMLHVTASSTRDYPASYTQVR